MVLFFQIVLLIFILIIVASITTKKWTRLWIAGSIIIVISCIFYGAMWILESKRNEWKTFQTISYMKELNAYIHQYAIKDKKILELFPVFSPQGRYLSDKEFEELQASFKQMYDSGELPKYDRWNNRFEIHYIRRDSEIERLSVISKGLDGIMGTSDDLIESMDEKEDIK